MAFASFITTAPWWSGYETSKQVILDMNKKVRWTSHRMGLRLPNEIILDSIAPLLSSKDWSSLALTNSRLRLLFVPLLIRSIDSSKHYLAEFLSSFIHQPHFFRHVKEFAVRRPMPYLVDTSLQILEVVGPTLESLILQDMEIMSNSVWMIRAINHCSNLKAIDLKFGWNSKEWLKSGGRDGLCAAIIKTIHSLEGISIADRQFNNDFWKTLLPALKPGQLSRTLRMRIGDDENDAIVALVSKQTGLSSLEIHMVDSPTGDEIQHSISNRYFHGFTKLRRLQVSLKPFLYFIPALDSFPNLRHLVFQADNCQMRDAWLFVQEAICSGSLNRLNQIDVIINSCYSGDIECSFFRLLAGDTSMAHFSFKDDDYRGEPKLVMTPPLDTILKNMRPNPNLLSLSVSFYMEDTTLLLLARFVSECRNLVSIRLDMPKRRGEVLSNEGDRVRFFRMLALAPKLESIRLPYGLRDE
ncbi:hypothetical protein HDU67_003601 [Dinochytrium kinnereticum]|nr:hypothetical protein HDU67_003601 [Dinochytrium kinnereticum]